MWVYNPATGQLIFVKLTPTQQIVDGTLDFGAFTGDLTVDAGQRTNDTSVIDQGSRIIDGSI